MSKRYLVTGGCGFLGSNLSCEVLKRGHELAVLDNLYRKGSEQNLEWLKTVGAFAYYKSDIRDHVEVDRVVLEFMPDVVFHVAGQVAMTTSLENPRLDFETNTVGTFNLLEALKKHAPKACVIYSSTNKVYGDLEQFYYDESNSRYMIKEFPRGIPETIPLDFRTPYGCSKGGADQYMKDFYRSYGLNTVVFRHSSIYGGRQFSSYEQGWIGWFVKQAIDIRNGTLNKPFTISGTGKQVRDVLFSSDLIDCYFLVTENIEKIKGEAFNIGGGVENSLSLIELFSLLENELGVKMVYERLPVRSSDQKVFIADNTKAKTAFGWEPLVSKQDGIKKMIEWIESIK